jgi:uncharacterized membrane protein YecN with MAPEG domain
MALTLAEKQLGVLRGMGVGATVSLLLILYGIICNPFGFPELQPIDSKLLVLGWSMLIPCLFLIGSIARIAKYRFFSPEDIDSSAATSSSLTLTCLQSMLQNTLEQTVLAMIVYTLWILLTPSVWLSVLPLSACCFLIGRILFIRGYHKGAVSRALGFALTFYPSIMMFTLILYSALCLRV